MSQTVTEPSDSIAARARAVRASLARAAERAGRAAEEVRLVAVSKVHPAASVREALAAGLVEFGENRVQEAAEKKAVLADVCAPDGRRARWHLIGNLQANKARRAVQTFDLIHTLDSAALAVRLDRICEEEARETFPVLVQVDLGGEETKSGVDERELREVVDAVRSSNHLRLAGLMTLPPFYEDVELVRPFFRRLRELRDDLKTAGAFGADAGELSMGMSHDYEIAIEEGATIVRVGTNLFGARPARVTSEASPGERSAATDSSKQRK